MSIMHFQSTIATGAASAVKLTDANVGDLQFQPTPSSTAGLTFGANGVLTFTGNSTPADPDDEWFVNQPVTNVGAGYQLRLTVSGGSAPTAGDPINTWITINVPTGFLLTTSGLSSTGEWLVEIRRVGSTSIEDSATFSMGAGVEPPPGP